MRITNLFLVLASGCAAVSSPRSLASTRPNSATCVSDVDIAGSGAASAYEALERRRPLFLTSHRAGMTADELGVYVDGHYIGGTTTLRGIAAAHVLEICRLTPLEARRLDGTPRFGALSIRTKR